MLHGEKEFRFELWFIETGENIVSHARWESGNYAAAVNETKKIDKFHYAESSLHVSAKNFGSVSVLCNIIIK